MRAFIIGTNTKWVELRVGEEPTPTKESITRQVIGQIRKKSAWGWFEYVDGPKTIKMVSVEWSGGTHIAMISKAVWRRKAKLFGLPIPRNNEVKEIPETGRNFTDSSWVKQEFRKGR